MNKRIKFNNIDMCKLEAICKVFSKELPEHSIILLYGELGAGKTTFVKTLGKRINIKKIIQSPTFSIVHEYENKNGFTMSHLDLYRIQKSNSNEDLETIKNSFNSNISIIEWPFKKVEKITAKKDIRIYFRSIHITEKRIIVMKISKIYKTKKLINKLKAIV